MTTYNEVKDGEAKVTLTGIELVYLDLDGVLVDFDRGWRQRLSEDSGLREAIRKYDAAFQGTQYPWTFWNDLGLLHDDFWGRLSDDTFWSELPWTEDGRSILEAALAAGRDRLYLLTHCPRLAGAYAGKYLWVKKHLPSLLSSLVTTGHKYLLARPDALLIDDGDHNVTGFAAAGGRAVQIPRPWNQKHRMIDTYRQLGPRQWLHANGVLAK